MPIRSLLKPLHGRGLRWPALRLLRQFIPASPHPGRELDVYWLSTGRCGTHFVDRVLQTDSSGHSLHEGGAYLPDVYRASAIWKDDPEAFWRLRLEDFAGAHAVVQENSRIPARVFNSFSNAMYPFGYMLHEAYERLGLGRRVKTIHLVREPVASCRSNLKVEREEAGGIAFARRAPAFVTGDSSAAKTASVWNCVNALCADTVDRIGDASKAITLRVEDLTIDRAEEIFDFCELRGFDRDRVEELLNNRSSSVRHSHVARGDLETVDATDEELEIIREQTAPLAARLGYPTV